MALNERRDNLVSILRASHLAPSGVRKRVRFLLTEPVPESKPRNKNPATTERQKRGEEQRRQRAAFNTMLLEDTIQRFPEQRYSAIESAVRQALIDETKPVVLVVCSEVEGDTLAAETRRLYYWPSNCELGTKLLYWLSLFHQAVISWDEQIFRQCHCDLLKACCQHESEWARAKFRDRLGSDSVGRFSHNAPTWLEAELYECVCFEYCDTM